MNSPFLLIIMICLILISCKSGGTDRGKIISDIYHPVTENLDCVSPLSITKDYQFYLADSCTHNEAISFLLSLKPEKKIVFDIWATWCGPCKTDFIEMKERKIKWKEKNLEFVYIATSSNSSIKKWQENAIEYDLKGSHLYLNYHAVSELNITVLGSNSIPRYVYFDENYKVVKNPFDVKFDPLYYRPDQKYVLIDSLLSL